MWQTSRGKFDRFPRTTAGYTLRTVDGYGLRCPWPTRPALTPHPVSVRRLACLLRASFGPRLTTTPLRFAILHLHQVGSGTFTLKLSNMLGTPGVAPPTRGRRRRASSLPAPVAFRRRPTDARSEEAGKFASGACSFQASPHRREVIGIYTSRLISYKSVEWNQN